MIRVLEKKAKKLVFSFFALYPRSTFPKRTERMFENV